jgi:hypothetical protein
MFHIPKQCFHIHILTDVRNKAKQFCPALKEVDCPAKVPVAPVVECHRHLQDPLVKVPGIISCPDPEFLKRFVAFEPGPGIKFANPLAEFRL